MQKTIEFRKLVTQTSDSHISNQLVIKINTFEDLLKYQIIDKEWVISGKVGTISLTELGFVTRSR